MQSPGVICEVCDNVLYGPKLDLGLHPLPDDLVPIHSKSIKETFRQEIRLCKICLTAIQIHPVPKERLFRGSYHYRASLTLDVVNGMRSLVDNLLRYLVDESSPTILDIGCNDGTLLNLFKERIDCVTIGIDPGEAITQTETKPDYSFQDYFDAKSAELIASKFPKLNLVTFTNVFAHIENLNELCNNLKKVISDSTLIVIENHYLGSVLLSSQFDTFYHEHPRTYSLRSLEFIAKKLDVEILSVEFPNRYGGNIRVVMSRKQTNHFKYSQSEAKVGFDDEEKFIEKFASLQRTFWDWRDSTSSEIESLISNYGPILGKSLPARAVMLISALGLDVDKMQGVYERPNSPKVGNLIPGTSIPILSDEELSNGLDKNLVVWSWHIIREVEPYLRDLGYSGRVWVPMPNFSRVS